MIRPITIVTFLMACGSGLYLYQSKHEVQLLDRTIEKTVHDTGTLREQSRLLSAEWTMLNDPDRLRQFSDTYLNLKSINPAQFTSLNDLGGKLPAPRIETPAPSPEEAPVVAETVLPSVDEAVPAAVAETAVLPVPPIPTVRPVQVATPPAHPTEAKVAIARAPVVADPKPAEPRLPEQRVAELKASPRVAEIRPEARTAVAPAPPKPIVLAAPRPQPMYAQPASVAAPAPAPFRTPAPAFAAPAPAPYSGSLLGMAHGPMPPAPRPMPVNATYSAN
jgi:hypothetical protein